MILFFLPKRLIEHLRKYRITSNLVNLIFVLLLVDAGFVFAVKFIEKVSYSQASWLCWQTITTVGYGDCPPKTGWGMLAVGLLGLLGFVCLTSVITASIEVYGDMKWRKEHGLMANPFKLGYVIINMPRVSSLMALIREIRAKEDEARICIVDNNIEELPAEVKAVPFVHFVRGPLLSHETYTQAKIDERKTVIVFPADANKPESDGMTQTIVSSIRQLSPGTKIVYILVDPSNKWLFKNLGGTPVLEDIEVLTIVQECQGDHTANVIQRLLSNTEGANPETVQPSLIVGWTWRQLQLAAIRTEETTGIEANFLSIIQDDIPHNCPPGNTVVREGDKICVVVHTPFNWSAYEEALVSRA